MRLVTCSEVSASLPSFVHESYLFWEAWKFAESCKLALNMLRGQKVRPANVLVKASLFKLCSLICAEA